MQTPADGAGVCVGIAFVCGQKRILPNGRTKHNLAWRHLCAATQDAETQQLVAEHRARLTAHLGNIVFLGVR